MLPQNRSTISYRTAPPCTLAEMPSSAAEALVIMHQVRLAGEGNPPFPPGLCLGEEGVHPSGGHPRTYKIQAAKKRAAHGTLLYHIPAMCVKKTPAAGIVKPRQTRYNRKEK